MKRAFHLVGTLLEDEDDFNVKELLRRGHEMSRRKRTKNLGWLLRNWKTVLRLSFEYHPQDMVDGELMAELTNGSLWVSEFASLSVCWDWLDRPVFRGRPFILIRPDGARENFVVGNTRWKSYRQTDTGVEGHRRFLRKLGLLDE